MVPVGFSPLPFCRPCDQDLASTVGNGRDQRERTRGMDLNGHLENYLGTLTRGWSEDPEGRKLPYSLALFESGRELGLKHVTTLGLSRYALSLGWMQIRMELLMSFRESRSVPLMTIVPALMQQVASLTLQQHTAYLPGHVVDLWDVLFEGSKLSALLVMEPKLLPDEFDQFTPAGGETIFISYLLPITASEAAFVRANGAEEFEREFTKRRLDLADFSRPSIV